AEVTKAMCTPPEPRNCFTASVFDAFNVWAAPSDFASESFSSAMSIAVTSAPAARPICTARWPRPPTPKTANRCPALSLACLRARCTVTPAQSSGAACSEESASGILTTWLAGAFANSAYPPSTMTPVMRCRTHRFSLPSRQNSHCPHVHCTHGNPTRSPTWTLSWALSWTLCTAAPRSTTRPTISCPRISGCFTMPANCVQSPSATCRSECHTPQTSTSIKTSSAPTSGRATSSSDNGVLNACRTAAFIALSSLTEMPHQLRIAGRSRKTLRPDAAQEKLHRAPHPVGELVRPGQIHRPLPHHRVVEPFHELRQMHHRERVRHFASLLPLRQNFPQQTGGSLLVSPQF